MYTTDAVVVAPAYLSPILSGPKWRLVFPALHRPLRLYMGYFSRGRPFSGRSHPCQISLRIRCRSPSRQAFPDIKLPSSPKTRARAGRIRPTNGPFVAHLPSPFAGDYVSRPVTECDFLSSRRVVIARSCLKYTCGGAPVTRPLAFSCVASPLAGGPTRSAGLCENHPPSTEAG